MYWRRCQVSACACKCVPPPAYFSPRHPPAVSFQECVLISGVFFMLEIYICLIFWAFSPCKDIHVGVKNLLRLFMLHKGLTETRDEHTSFRRLRSVYGRAEGQREAQGFPGALYPDLPHSRDHQQQRPRHRVCAVSHFSSFKFTACLSSISIHPWLIGICVTVMNSTLSL